MRIEVTGYSIVRGAAPLLRFAITRADHYGRAHLAQRLLPGIAVQVPDELVGLGELAAERRPVRICEIGTWFGSTSLFLAGLSPSVKSYVGVDLEPRNYRLVSALAPRGVTTSFVRGSSQDPATRKRVLAALGDEELDLLFIDGDHSYDGVRADLMDYRNLVRPGGLIALHDIVSDHAARYGSGTENSSGDVPRFWREIRQRFRHWEFVQDWDQDGYGIGVIEHDPDVPVDPGVPDLRC